MPPVLSCLFFHHHLLHRTRCTCYLWASCVSNPSEQRLLFRCLKGIYFLATVLALCLCWHEHAAARRGTPVSSSLLSAFSFEAESLLGVCPHIFSAVLEAVSPRGTPVPVPSELGLQVCARLVSHYVGAGIWPVVCLIIQQALLSEELFLQPHFSPIHCYMLRTLTDNRSLLSPFWMNGLRLSKYECRNPPWWIEPGYLGWRGGTCSFLKLSRQCCSDGSLGFKIFFFQ